ncbi:DUF5302 domain-containing protein [Nocardioides sp. AE5]|uniref:DUF5302 domain-containing protein n=1 Tax=Nocardioides sp. AE5 TaxID=2962573 RepID=UPI0028833772|nr:DUF5302 domain-containing protein [Nocardioides sp. AE5]
MLRASRVIASPHAWTRARAIVPPDRGCRAKIAWRGGRGMPWWGHRGSIRTSERECVMTDASDANADLKARMREALDRKNQASHPTDADGKPVREKVHGSEVEGGAPKMHRRKAGGGGS